MSQSSSRLRALCPEPDNYSEVGLEAIRRFADLTLQVMGADELHRCIADYELLFVRLRTRVPGALLREGRRLRAVVSPTTGLNHIDLESASSLGIEIFHLRGQSEILRTIPSTAEHTWGLLLALARQIPAASRSVLAGSWSQETFRGRELKGKCLGILGFGRLGSVVSKYARAFGMDVVAFDPYVDDVPSHVRRCRTMAELLRSSDVLSIHVPLNEETEGLIGWDEIDLLPEGSMFVNTSRGEIVDEEALILALTSGRISGAAVDVLQREHTIRQGGNPLIAYAREHDNLIITPHIGGATFEAVAKTDLFLIARLVEWLGSTPPAARGSST